MKKILPLLPVFFSAALSAQDSAPLPLGNPAYDYYDRVLIQQNSGECTALKPYLRSEVVEKFNESLEAPEDESQDVHYVKNDNADYLGDEEILRESAKPLFKVLYVTPQHFYEFKKEHFRVAIDPVFSFRAGYESAQSGSGINFENRRGVEVRGNIDGKVYFYSRFTDAQSKFPSYVMEQVADREAVPGAGYYKEYNSIFSKAPLDGYDYMQAQGLIGFNATKHIGFQVGHGRNFIGDGIRSMFLSDFSNDYFYFKINTKVWKFQYQNIFAQLTGDYNRGGDQLLPKKFMASHYLGINLFKGFNLGIFESVIFSRRNGGFELQYLNPLILYRTVEHALGSPDNVVLGASMRWNMFKHVSLYGQLLLDEFRFNEFFSGSGWWANKYGIQAGVKYSDMFGVANLSGQLELNIARPYLYTHNDSTANYTHYNQPLAHPLGSGFREVIGIVRYRPTDKLTLTAKLFMAKTGLDTLGSNWGSNIFITNDSHEQDYDNKIGQGVTANILFVGFRASYMIKHNFFVDLELAYRRRSTDLEELDRSSTTFGVGLRLNLAERDFDF